MKRILSIILILALLFALFPFQSSLSEEITPPEGFMFSKDYQRIPVTLNSITYYAYEIEKTENNTHTVGWLIVDSSNKIVSEKSTYEKLALASTVTKYIKENPNVITIMEADLKMLNEMKWKMALNEVAQSIIKAVSSYLGTMTGNVPMGAFEEAAGMASFVPQTLAIELSDNYLDDFTHWVANTFSDILLKTGEINGILDTGPNFLKFSGVFESIIKKGALISAKKGIDSYSSAYNILKNHTGPWSYEDAQKFLEGYTKGKAQAVAYGSWYLRLIHGDMNFFAALGLNVWDNVVKQVLPAKIEDIKDVIDASVKFVPLYAKIIKQAPDKFFYNQVEKDIEDMTMLLGILRLYYDTSLADSPASRTYNAIKNEEEASIKDKTIYKIGDRVQATDYINVREDASLKGKVKSVIKKGEIGTIESNYKIADGYRWWTVKWNSGPEGWCAGEYLKIYTSTAKDYYFPSVTTTININSDGSFDVVEKRTYEFSGDFHWATYALAKEGYTKLENFSIGDDNGNYKMTTSETGDSGTYTFSENSSSYTAKFFYSANNEEKTFTIRYRIIGGIKAYQDVSDFYWKLVGTGWDKKTGYFEAYIYLPSKVNENSLYVFGHGPSNGTIQKIDGNGVYYKVSNLAANTYVEARVVFPSNILSTTKIPESKLDSILKYENGSSEEGNQGKWVLVLGESLPVLSGISPAGHSIIGGECENSSTCWDTLSLVHSGDLLEYISTDAETYSSNLYLAFPGCTKAFKVKDKKGNIGWIIGEWDGIVLAQVVDSKMTQNFKPVSFSKVSGKWSGHLTGTFFEEGELSFIFQQDDMLTFKGTGILTLTGSDMTKNVIVKGSIFNNSFSFLEVQPDGSYKYCSGTISSDGKTIEGRKYSYDTLAIPLGEFKLTLQGN